MANFIKDTDASQLAWDMFEKEKFEKRVKKTGV